MGQAAVCDASSRLCWCRLMCARTLMSSRLVGNEIRFISPSWNLTVLLIYGGNGNSSRRPRRSNRSANDVLHFVTFSSLCFLFHPLVWLAHVSCSINQGWNGKSERCSRDWTTSHRTIESDLFPQSDFHATHSALRIPVWIKDAIVSRSYVRLCGDNVDALLIRWRLSGKTGRGVRRGAVIYRSVNLPFATRNF